MERHFKIEMLASRIWNSSVIILNHWQWKMVTHILKQKSSLQKHEHPGLHKCMLGSCAILLFLIFRSPTNSSESLTISGYHAGYRYSVKCIILRYHTPNKTLLTWNIYVMVCCPLTLLSALYTSQEYFSAKAFFENIILSLLPMDLLHIKFRFPTGIICKAFSFLFDWVSLGYLLQ